VPAMKLTPNAAMRARDVSRPHAGHLAEAEAAEARLGRLAEGSRARTAGPGRGDANAGRGAGSQGPDGPGTNSPGTNSPGTNSPGTNSPGTNRAEITGERAAGTGDGRPDRAGFPRRRRRPRDGGRRGRPGR